MDKLKIAYQQADKEYQFGFAAYNSGAITYHELKAIESNRRKAFNKYAKAKKQEMGI